VDLAPEKTRKEREGVRGPWFNEAFDEDGTLRPSYAALRRRTGWDPLHPTAAVAEQLRDQPLEDDTRILPVPVVIDDTEYQTVIQAGVAQRARALQRLFADLVLGSGEILAAGIGLGEDLLSAILAVEGTSLERLRHLWTGHLRDGVRFVYGPDLVRDPDGRWTVLEDNVGCVGGAADCFFVADRYRTATGLDGCPACRPQPDLAVAVRRWLRRLAAGRQGAVAVLGCDTGDGPWAMRLHENARRRLILDMLGIPVIDPGRLRRQSTADGHHVTVVNFDVDGSWSDLFNLPGAALFNAPGTGVLGNKALMPFIDDVIRFYTRQEPILRTPPTRLLTDGVLPVDTNNWVVKTAAGCQGTEVFVLRWQPRDRRDLVADRVRKEWSGVAAVAQRYVEPSRLTPAGPTAWDGYRVEIRPVTYVLDWQDAYVSEQPVGKVVSVYDARRLNNISQGACYAPVLREPCPRCNTPSQVPSSDRDYATAS
jgi:uncharacterized circularly permuted ATP-grasp superfamily protein